jgi:murein DD-endopeptidase MepM/ murein hydrolase activator NlpD
MTILVLYSTKELRISFMFKLFLIIGTLLSVLIHDTSKKNLDNSIVHSTGNYTRTSFDIKEFCTADYSIFLYAQKFSQGNVVYVEIIPADSSIVKQQITILNDNIPIYLSKFSWGYRGFFAIQPDEAPGEKLLTLEYTTSEKPVKYFFPFAISKSNFPLSHTVLKVGKYSDVNNAKDSQIVNFIIECSQKKRNAFSRTGPDMIGATLSKPRTILAITSPFWSSRIYERYEIKNNKRIELPSQTKIHKGIDLRGRQGDPVFALADGEVLLAEKMYYEGNLTVLDHGNRIMTYYMHQDSILVHAGQIVHAGDTIGKVGATGVSTAPHLHLSLVIDGIQVDPLSILPLPVRDSSLSD